MDPGLHPQLSLLLFAQGLLLELLLLEDVLVLALEQEISVLGRPHEVRCWADDLLVVVVLLGREPEMSVGSLSGVDVGVLVLVMLRVLPKVEFGLVGEQVLLLELLPLLKLLLELLSLLGVDLLLIMLRLLLLLEEKPRVDGSWAWVLG